MVAKQTGRRKGGPPRLVALGFLIAFAASVLTLIYTGLRIKSSDSVSEPRRGDQAAVAEARPDPPVDDGRAAADGPDSAGRDEASRDGAGADGDSEATTSGPEAGSRAPAD